ncbi:lytic murein transglycosylase [Mesorhizobium sp. M1B.F.Ca.ET.045.04.1.1]|nr:lytic murein transglycosylase [Mesorhizobium sp. M1B.F.Ca.ET.045.04.1.1]
MFAFLRAPLCPTGHLPLKGGDWPSRQPSQIPNVAGWAAAQKPPISPLEGEMAGRPEGVPWRHPLHE